MLNVLVLVMFEKLGEKTLYVFAVCNFLTIPIIWALYPETNQRTLEEINFIFASESIWNWNAERKYKELTENHTDNPHTGADAQEDHERLIDGRAHAESVDEDDKDDDWKSALENQRSSCIVN